MKYGRVLIVTGLLTLGGGVARADDSRAAIGADWQSMQTSMTHVGQDVDAYIRDTQKMLADNEAEKKTLIECLKAAQAQAEPPNSSCRTYVSGDK